VLYFIRVNFCITIPISEFIKTILISMNITGTIKIKTEKGAKS